MQWATKVWKTTPSVHTGEKASFAKPLPPFPQANAHRSITSSSHAQSRDPLQPSTLSRLAGDATRCTMAKETNAMCGGVNSVRANPVDQQTSKNAARNRRTLPDATVVATATSAAVAQRSCQSQASLCITTCGHTHSCTMMQRKTSISYAWKKCTARYADRQALKRKNMRAPIVYHGPGPAVVKLR